MTKYVALINTPAYLPWDDEPPTFDNPWEAWVYLADQRRRQEDDAEDAHLYPAYTDTVHELDRCADNGTGIGTVYGPTPGYDGEHDLGLAYSVDIDEEWIES